MSTVFNKHILFSGKNTPQTQVLKDKLNSKGAKNFFVGCADITLDYLNDNDIDLVVYNHVAEVGFCANLKKLLTNEHISKVLPVFLIVDNVEADIQSILTYGIADYITANEDADTVVQKIEAVFSEDQVFSGSSSIDISPIEADISSTGIRVFIVEDDPLLRNLLSLRLDKSGFPYEFSKDGKEVGVIIKQFKPDIIILDLMLPGISGFEVLEQIKADGEIGGIPVLVFSNKDGIDDRERAKSLGANDFYVKALTDLSELMESIEDLVKKSKQ
jgi:DNA-binding response OmpR family regulator